LTATAGLTWAQLLKRPEVTIEPVLGTLREALAAEPQLEEMAAAVAGGHPLPSVLRNEARAVETEIKFAGYLDQQKKSIEKLKAAEAVAIPEWIEYGTISGLSREIARDPEPGASRHHRPGQPYPRCYTGCNRLGARVHPGAGCTTRRRQRSHNGDTAKQRPLSCVFLRKRPLARAS